MNLMHTFKKLAVAATLLAAGAAHASIFQYNLTGDTTAQFQLDTTLPPDVSAEGAAFVIANVTGNFPGLTSPTAVVTFYNTAFGGGFEIDNADQSMILVSTNGPQLYTGSESDPNLLLGTFLLTEYQGTGNYVLAVTDVTSVVPEPATGAMLFGGLAILYAMRKRRTV